jgi:thioredoxin-related protein
MSNKISRIVFSSLLTSCCIGMIVVGAFGRTIPRHKIEWRANLDAAHKESVEKNKPMLLFFESDTCAFCRKMNNTTLKDQGLIWSINRSYIPVKMNVREHRKIALKLEIKRIPATIALTPHADLLGGTIGYVDARQFREMLYEVKALNARVNSKTARSASSAR